MKDKVLQRRIFREKALKKYGGDMLPKFKIGDLVENKEKQGPLDSGIASIRKVFPNFLNVTGEDKNTSPSIGQPYDSRKAMILAVAGRLLQADQRPGEGMFSGVGRGVGKAITEDFPIINKLKLEDRAARQKTTKTPTTKQYFDSLSRKLRPVPVEELLAKPEQFYDLKAGNIRFLETIPGTPYKQGDTITFTAAQKYDMFFGENKGLYANKIAEGSTQLSPNETYALGQKIKQDDEIRKGETENINDAQKLATKTSGFLNASRIYREKTNEASDEFGGGGIGAAASFAQWLDNSKVAAENTIQLLGGGDKNKERELRLQDQAIRGKASKIISGKVAKDDDGIDIEDYFNNGAKYGKTKEQAAANKRLWGRITQAAEGKAGRDAVFTELMYRIAKMREEGGRFSVSDIELAAKALGGTGSSPAQAMAALNALEEQFTTDAFNELNTRLKIRPIGEDGSEPINVFEMNKNEITDKTEKEMLKVHKQDIQTYVKNPWMRPIIKKIHRIEKARLKQGLIMFEAKQKRLDKKNENNKDDANSILNQLGGNNEQPN
tara:strand:- start:2584 stop:4236 length:1653 start_codon:yes stop_codon:yes gene_type:complete